jgi:hypothetical protein
VYKYFCVENEELVCILDYEPEVPSTVSVVPIYNEHACLMENGTHYFDPKTMKVVAYPKGTTRDSYFSDTESALSKNPICIPVNTSIRPEWAKADLFFSYELVGADSGVLSVINNTGFAIIASASTNVGQFTEVMVHAGAEYHHECKYSDSPMGFLMFRATNTKKR